MLIRRQVAHKGEQDYRKTHLLRVFGSKVVKECGGAGGGGHTDSVEVVLDQDGHAEEAPGQPVAASLASLNRQQLSHLIALGMTGKNFRAFPYLVPEAITAFF